MFSLATKIEDHTRRVREAAEKANYKNFRHAAASIRKAALASIEKSDEPSAPGEPPHTRGRRGKNLKTAIRFDADKDSAVIGPRASVIGEAGAVHEFGETFEGQQFDERPFMTPALEKNLDRFAGDWAGSIGE